MPYAFNSLAKAQALSEYADYLASTGQGPYGPNPGEQYPPITPPQLMNDLRYRTKIVLVELVTNITAASEITINQGQPEERIIWSAGQGEVRILQKYSETADPPPVPPNNEVGAWKQYSHGAGPGIPTTSDPAIRYQTRETLAYNYLPQEISSDSGSSQPVRALCVEDVHGELWIIASSLEKQKNIQPVEATTCIYPGQGGIVNLYEQQPDGTWIPTASDTGTLVDPQCQVMALPGEVFWVEMSTDPNLGTPTVQPIADHGLRRRVRSEVKIGCGAKGTVKILRQTTSTTDCGFEETTCTIEVCNKSNTTILCHTSTPHHDGWARCIHDKHTDGTTGNCRWYMEPDPMAMEAEATLGPALCTGAYNGEDLVGVEFTDVCTWNESLDGQVILNSSNRRACAGKKVWLKRDMRDCSWYVSEVERIGGKHFIDFTSCTDDECTDLRGVYFNQAAVEACDCTQYNDPILPLTPVSVGMGWRVDSNPLAPSCELVPLFKEICVPCNPNKPIVDGVPMAMNQQNVLGSIRLDTDGVRCQPIGIWQMCPPVAVAETLCIPTNECEAEEPVEDI